MQKRKKTSLKRDPVESYEMCEETYNIMTYWHTHWQMRILTYKHGWEELAQARPNYKLHFRTCSACSCYSSNVHWSIRDPVWTCGSQNPTHTHPHSSVRPYLSSHIYTCTKECIYVLHVCSVQECILAEIQLRIAFRDHEIFILVVYIQTVQTVPFERDSPAFREIVSCPPLAFVRTQFTRYNCPLLLSNARINYIWRGVSWNNVYTWG